MANSIRVIIGGKEYSLKGDNEHLIRYASDEVNKQLSALGLKHNEESSTTLSILAALNLSEQNILRQNQLSVNSRFITNELEAMADFLTNNLNN